MAECIKESANIQEAAKVLVTKAEIASGQAQWKEQEISLQDTFTEQMPSSLQSLFTKPAKQELSTPPQRSVESDEQVSSTDEKSSDKKGPKPDDMTAIVVEIKEKENVEYKENANDDIKDEKYSIESENIDEILEIKD